MLAWSWSNWIQGQSQQQTYGGTDQQVQHTRGVRQLNISKCGFNSE